MARAEIRPLTGIRGVAALLVVVYHLDGFDAPSSLRIGGLAGHLVNHGYLSVDLFFVLSGYVMALSYGDMLRVWDGRAYVRFLIRRIARVYPLYCLLTLAIAFTMFAGISHQAMPDLGSTLGWNLAMLQGWGFAHSLDTPAWSISTEWGAYLLFPLLASFTLFGNRRAVIAAAMLSAAVIVVLGVLPFGGEGPLDIYGPGSALARCVAEFSMGLIAFRTAQMTAVQAWARHPASGLLLALAIVGLLFLPRSDLAIVALLPPFIVVLGVGRGPVQRVLGSPVLFLAGEISYALYLLHTRFVRFRAVLEAHLTPLLGSAAPGVTCAVVYGLLLTASWLAYRYVEKPARAWVRHAEYLVPRDPPQGSALLGSVAPEAIASYEAPPYQPR